jgi:hypothetical protein
MQNNWQWPLVGFLSSGDDMHCWQGWKYKCSEIMLKKQMSNTNKNCKNALVHPSNSTSEFILRKLVIPYREGCSLPALCGKPWDIYLNNGVQYCSSKSCIKTALAVSGSSGMYSTCLASMKTQVQTSVQGGN